MTSLLAKFILQKMDESVVPPWTFLQVASGKMDVKKTRNFPAFADKIARSVS